MNKKLAIAIVVILLGALGTLVAANTVLTEKSAGAIKTIFATPAK